MPTTTLLAAPGSHAHTVSFEGALATGVGGAIGARARAGIGLSRHGREAALSSSLRAPDRRDRPRHDEAIQIGAVLGYQAAPLGRAHRPYPG